MHSVSEFSEGNINVSVLKALVSIVTISGNAISAKLCRMKYVFAAYVQIVAVILSNEASQF